MKVILLSDVSKVGKKGAIVEVADGYARNFLIRNRLAVQATAKSLEILDEQKVQQKLNEKEMEAKARETASQLEKSCFSSRSRAVRKAGSSALYPPNRLLRNWSASMAFILTSARFSTPRRFRAWA